ncbi:S-layer homology domain-containing protein [Lacrimispora sp.]|uniref:S-layer homology domain-containing protein n=1 Tax=Lacrimispora sp. TaxID=2719234 RepID=UPI002FDA39C8
MIQSQSNKVFGKRVLALLLSTAVAFGGMTIPASAETVSVGTSSNTITSFEELPEDVTSQTVELGTPQEKLNLPETLCVTVMTESTLTVELDSGDVSDIEEQSEEEMEAPETEGVLSEATPSDSKPVDDPEETFSKDVEDTVSEELSVIWTSERFYDPEEEDTYIFTPTLPEGYALADGVSLPEISVTVWVEAPAKLMMGLMSTSTIDYADENGVAQDPVTATLIEGTAASLSDGWYYAEGSLIINNSLTINGDVNIILTDDCDLTVNGGNVDAGINVSGSNSLTIYAQSTGNDMGALTVISGSHDCAGIGGKTKQTGGTITINGGTVTATGGPCAAGIGGGGNYPYGGDGGTITINGGIVTATASPSLGDPAGIGGGGYGNAGTIKITGGTVIANGSQKGIGSGAERSGGTIEISGGTVTANGIGTGGYDASASITISGNAFVVCTSTAYGGIAKNDQTNWSGVVIEGNIGAVYGMVTLTDDAEIPSGVKLTISDGAELTIPDGKTLTNSGTILVESGGVLTISGTLINNNTIVKKGTITGTISGADAVLPSLAGSVSITGTPVYGAMLTANTGGITSSEPGAFAYQWKRNGTTIIGTDSTYTLTTADIGHTITVSITATNYDGELSSGGVIITKAVAPSITFPTSATAITYGQTLASATLNSTSDVNGTFAWTAPSTAPTVAQSGSPFEVTYTPTDPANYDYTSVTLTANVAVTVLKAAGSFGSPSALNITYTNTLTLAEVTLPANYAWTNSSTSITSAGSGQTFPATYTDPSGNYEPANGNITVNVAKVTPSLTLGANPTNTQSRPGSVELTATLPADATGTLTFKAGASTIAVVTLPVNTATFTPVGAENSYSFTVEYSGDSNYESKISTTLEYSFIKSEQANVIVSDGSVNYGETLDLSTLVSGGSGTGALSFSKIDGPGEIGGATLTPTGAGDVNIIVAKAADHDYNVKSAAFKVTVNPRAITFMVATVGTQAHTGNPVTPTPEVKDGTTVLTEGVHFNYSYSNNIDGGVNATINIIGIGSYAGSTGYTTFTIGGSVPGITTPPSVSGTVYTGTALSQISLTGGVATVSGYFEWVNPSATATYGSNTFEVRFVPEDSILYAQVSGINVTFNAVNYSNDESNDNDRSDSRDTTITDSMVKVAIDKALEDAKAKGNTANGISVNISVTAIGAAGFSINLERSALNRLLEAGVTSFSISSLPVNMSFDRLALKQIQSQSGGNLAITVKPTTVTGLRNAFDITLNSTKDGKVVNITSLGNGTSTLNISAEPGENEFGGYLYGAYVGADKKINRIANSAYDSNSRRMIFSTNHFSVYGVGYTAPSDKLADIGSHWAKDSIDYVVGRGLFGGGTSEKFQPDTAITRGDFVTALGRLSGANTSGYTSSSFTDVKADAYSMPYIEWTYKKGIIQGISGSRFAPDRPITREEIAVILQNYAKATGYTLPVTRNAVSFTDASSIGSGYETAVTAMQQAGIMMGGTGNKFNPKSNATRAEASAMLHRYIKLAMDPATAQDWTLNDDGQYLYYRGGAAVTGWQTIDGVKYHFYSTGVLQTGWVKDNDENWRFYSGKTMLVGFSTLGANGDNKTYYFNKDGIMVAGKWLEIDGKWYYLNADGTLAQNTKIDGCEVDENGVRKTK